MPCPVAERLGKDDHPEWTDGCGHILSDIGHVEHVRFPNHHCKIEAVYITRSYKRIYPQVLKVSQSDFISSHYESLVVSLQIRIE